MSIGFYFDDVEEELLGYHDDEQCIGFHFDDIEQEQINKSARLCDMPPIGAAIHDCDVKEK